MLTHERVFRVHIQMPLDARLSDDTIADALHQALPPGFQVYTTEFDDADLTLEELDAKYHDHLPYGTNCKYCNVDHPAINPQALGR